MNSFQIKKYSVVAANICYEKTAHLHERLSINIFYDKSTATKRGLGLYFRPTLEQG